MSLLVTGALLSGCGGSGSATGDDSGAPDDATTDSSADAEPGDAAADSDVMPSDAAVDAGLDADAGAFDSGMTDSGPTDAGFDSARDGMLADGGDADVADGSTVEDGGPDASTDNPPQASCYSAAEAFPDSIEVVADASDPDGDLLDSISWRLASQPPDSSLSFTDPGTSSFTFTPDEPGFYEFCVTAEAGGLTSDEGCCRVSAADEFVWSFVPTRSTQYVEDVAFQGGSISFSFERNQGFSSSSVDYTVSDSDWSLTAAGSARSLFRSTIRADVDLGSSDTSVVSAGDEVTITVQGDPLLTGPAGSTMNGTITLETAPDPGSSTPRIVEVDTGPLFAGSPARISVRFDAARPTGDDIVIGGWALASLPSIDVRDDGGGDDPTAGDGWYSGRFDVPSSGTYEVLILPRTGDYGTPSYAEGPYFSTTFVVP